MRPEVLPWRGGCGILPAICGAVAQSGERLVRNEEVGGSNPPSSTKSPTICAQTSALWIPNLGGVNVSESASLTRKMAQPSSSYATATGARERSNGGHDVTHRLLRVPRQEMCELRAFLHHLQPGPNEIYPQADSAGFGLFPPRFFDGSLARMPALGRDSAAACARMIWSEPSMGWGVSLADSDARAVRRQIYGSRVFSNSGESWVGTPMPPDIEKLSIRLTSTTWQLVMAACVGHSHGISRDPLDDETGAYLHAPHHYDPVTGRFISKVREGTAETSSYTAMITPPQA